jgi:transposase-like protein
MNPTIAAPRSLLEAVKYFGDPDIANTFAAAIRWPKGVSCPACGSERVTYMAPRRLWNCNECRKQSSVKVGTIFEDSAIPLTEWLPAVWLLANCKNGISSYELARALGVTQKTAWFMNHRIRLAMQSGSIMKFKGHVEADETFVGGKSKFMHRTKREGRILGRGQYASGKKAIMGLLERSSKGRSRVLATVIPNTRKGHTRQYVRDHVAPSSNVYTDAFPSYRGLKADYVHDVIDHAEAYARGKVHTNGLENFWSLLKRAIKGTYTNVEPFHLFRYLDEQVFRFNNRKTKDVARFIDVLRRVIGKRLTYSELIGADMEPATT